LENGPTHQHSATSTAHKIAYSTLDLSKTHATLFAQIRRATMANSSVTTTLLVNGASTHAGNSQNKKARSVLPRVANNLVTQLEFAGRLISMEWNTQRPSFRLADFKASALA